MRALSLTIIFLLTLHSSFAQQNVQSFLEQVERNSSLKPQEKIYLHLDKYSYTAGETIWLKSYTVLGINNFLSNLSGIAYVDLIDPTQKIIKSVKFPLVMGIGFGDITLHDTIPDGSYRLRAYTNWMRNDDEIYFYDRTIQVSNGRTDNVKASTVATTSEKDHIYTVTLTSLSGLPLTKTQVNYEVISEDKIISKKRATTNEKGILEIKLDKKHVGSLLKLRFENLEKYTVNKLIKAIDPTLQNSIQVFPEGGKILANTVNNIAIKTLTPKGLGIKAKISIVSEADTISTFETNDLGMGSAYMYAMAGADIKAIAEFEDGSHTEVPLPKAEESGFAIIVNNHNPEKLFTQLNTSEDQINQQEVYLVVHHLGQIIYVGKQKLTKTETVFTTDKRSFPSGVLTISILNHQFLPITERAIFNYNPSKILPIVAKLNKDAFGTREKVNVDISIGLDTDSIRMSALSSSVIDLSRIQEDYKLEPNILTTLLLSNDLRGFIENPGYYFSEGGVNSQDIDNLMLTQGWRNIEWEAMTLEPKPEKFKPESAISISGYTRKFGRKAAEPNTKVTLLSTKNFMDFIDTVSNEEGYFEFNDLLFPDSVKFILSARTEKGKATVDIVENKFEYPLINQNKNAAQELDNVNSIFSDQIVQSRQYFAQLEAMGMIEKVVAIDEVVVRARQKPKVTENSRNLNGPGNADQVITAEDLETCTTLEMCLAGRLTGVNFVNGVPYNTRGNVPMQIVLDGMYIESDQLNMINLMDVESIEVLRNINYTAVYGSYGGNGLLVITSKTGSSAMNKPFIPKGILTIQPKGIHVNKVFYKPSYEPDDQTQKVPDMRTTIHWEKGLSSNKEGKSSFDFYTSDGKGKYLMVIEGIDLNGRIGYKAVEFEVK